MKRNSVALFLLACCFCVSTNALTSPKVKLSSGYEMPIVGFGTHFRTETEEAQAIWDALETGYRHFDTAYFYKNEKNLGTVLKKWFENGGKREDIFITTKLPPQGIRASDVETYLKLSLEHLRTNYVDLYLLHTPFSLERNAEFDPLIFPNGSYGIDMSSDFIATWKEMEKQVKAGRVRSIGISNFNETQILRLWDVAEIKPSSLQIEGNIYLQQEKLRKLCSKLGIVPTAYSPLGSNDISHYRRKREAGKNVVPPPLKNPVVMKIAKKHNKTVAQVLLRFDVELGFVIIPKSSKPKRMRENFDLFDFTLTEEDIKELKALDLHGKVRKFDFQTWKGMEKHPEYPFTDKIPKA